MKKKIIFLVLAAFMCIVFANANVYAINPTPHLEVVSATVVYENSEYLVSGSLKVLDGFDGQNDYVISIKDLVQGNTIIYNRITSLDIDTSWYIDTEQDDLYDYYEMRANLEYLQGIEGMRFMTHQDFDVNTIITFSICLHATGNYQSVNDCKNSIHVYQYSGYNADKCFNIRANAYISDLNHKAVLEGRITFDNTKPYESGWYLLNFQTFVDYYGLEFDLASVTLNCSKKAIKDSLEDTLMVFVDNNSCYFYLPAISNPGNDIIEFTAMFGGDVGGNLITEVQRRVKLTKMSATLAGLAPTSSENTYKYTTSVENPVPLADIVEILSVVAIDDYDGDLTDDISVTTTSNYTTKVENASVEDREIGNYPVIISVTDSNNNTSTLNLVISVVDNTKPEIELIESRIDLGYTSMVLTESDIMELLEVQDNYYSNFTYEIDMDDYLANHNVVGEYEIYITVTDGSGNSETTTLTINIIDDVPPVFNATTEFKKSASTAISAPEIADLCVVSVRDEISGACSYTIIEDNYTLNSDVVGTYTIKLKATDDAGNSRSLTIRVTVEDTEKPYLYIQGDILIVNYNASYNANQIFSEFVQNGTFKEGSELIEVVEDNYTDNARELGIYGYSMRVKEDGEEKVVNVSIKVEREIDSVQKLIKEPFIQRVINKLAKLLSKSFISRIKETIKGWFQKSV